jgi:hypothetical protein
MKPTGAWSGRATPLGFRTDVLGGGEGSFFRAIFFFAPVASPQPPIRSKSSLATATAHFLRLALMFSVVRYDKGLQTRRSTYG